MIRTDPLALAGIFFMIRTDPAALAGTVFMIHAAPKRKQALRS